MTKPKSQTTELRAKLDTAIRQTRTTRFYQSVNILWPNSFAVLTRVAQFVGDEVRLPGDKVPFLERILVQTKKHLSQAEASGEIRFENRDRDYLVAFLHGLFSEVGKVFLLQVCTSSSYWDPHTEACILWRRHTQGELRCEWIRQDATTASAELVKKAAEALLDSREVAILGQDLPRVWGQTPEQPVLAETDNKLMALETPTRTHH